MNRLTERDWKDKYKCEEYKWNMHPVKNIDDLPYYRKLAKYEDLEEQGKLVVLPCKPGTVVFCIVDDCTYGADCHTKKMCDTCDYRDLHIELEIMATTYEIVLHMDQFGKTIFLTEEEANKKLAHMQNKN